MSHDHLLLQNEYDVVAPWHCRASDALQACKNKAAMQALDAKLQDQLAKVSVEQRRGEAALRDLLEEHRDETREILGKRRLEQLQSAEDITASLREELSGRHSRFDAARTAALESTAAKLQEDLAKVSKAHTALKDLFAEHRGEIESSYARRMADMNASMELLDSKLSEELGGRIDRGDAELKAQIQALEAEARRDTSRLDREVNTRVRDLVERHRADFDSHQSRSKEVQRTAAENFDARIEELSGRIGRAEPSMRSSVQALAAKLREEMAGANVLAVSAQKAAINDVDKVLRMEMDNRQNRMDTKLQALSEKLSAETSAQQDFDGFAIALSALEARLREELVRCTIVVGDLSLEDAHGQRRSFENAHDFLAELARRMLDLEARLFLESAAREEQLQLAVNCIDASPVTIYKESPSASLTTLPSPDIGHDQKMSDVVTTPRTAPSPKTVSRSFFIASQAVSPRRNQSPQSLSQRLAVAKSSSVAFEPLAGSLHAPASLVSYRTTQTKRILQPQVWSSMVVPSAATRSATPPHGTWRTSA